MLNVDITTAVTSIIAAGNRQGRTLVIQNQSDTTMRLAIGAPNIALLTDALGIQLEPAESIALAGADATHAVAAIHAGSGDKVAHYQLV